MGWHVAELSAIVPPELLNDPNVDRDALIDIVAGEEMERWLTNHAVKRCCLTIDADTEELQPRAFLYTGWRRVAGWNIIARLLRRRPTYGRLTLTARYHD